MATSNNGLNLNPSNPLPPSLGGSGVNNGASTFTMAGNVQFSGAHTFNATLTADTAITFPVGGALVDAAQIQENFYNTAVDSGIANAYVANMQATSGTIPTAGSSYWVNISNANSGASTLNLNSSGPINIVSLDLNALVGGELPTGAWGQFIYNGISYVLQNSVLSGTGSVNPGTANQLAFYASSGNTVSGVGPGSSGQLLQSAGAGASPAYTTATYPSTASSTGTLLRANGTNWVPSSSTFADTYSINNILYASGGNAVTGLATANSAMLVTNSSGVPAFTAPMTNGQVVVGFTGGTPVPSTLTAGNGISILNAAGSITLSASGGGTSWTDEAASPVAMTPDSAYLANTGGLLTFTLPGLAAFGTVISIAGFGTGGWTIAQNAGQNIQVGAVSSTVGVGGSVSSSNQFDSINLVCAVANTTWVTVGPPQGILTVV